MKTWMRNLVLGAVIGGVGLVMAGCSDESAEPGPPPEQQARDFIDGYTGVYKDLYYKANLADWRSNTRIVEGDGSAALAAREAGEALAAFTGGVETIERARALLAGKDQLTPLQARSIEAILYTAANAPQTVPDLVRRRIALEVGLNEKLFGFDFRIDGAPVTTNDIDAILKSETDLGKRLKAWVASKEVGKVLKPGLAEVRDLRNRTVQALGYDDYFSYQVSEYGMSRDEMMALTRRINAELYPLYRELHTYARYELAKRYGVDKVPDLLPADWLPNRWGQDWSAMVHVEGIDLDAALAKMTPEQLVRQAEKFYVGIGFDPLPESFYERSSLYPVPPGAGYKKNNHASAWHLDLDQDIRSLMSVETNTEWYETVHHELGHIYYYRAYSNPEVPLVLRGGANRAFHEAMGSLMGLASMQQPFLEAIGLAPEGAQVDKMQALLKEALNYVVFIPFSTGLMTEFEHDLYAGDLPIDQFNKRWWALKAQYQGIAPPSPRGEDYADAASKTHIINDAAQYYDYALSYLILFQLHDHIAREILHQDPHASNYFGRREVGDFLRSIMKSGASRDWREVMREATGQDLSAAPMLAYFEPLMAYLKKVNAGRTYTLEAPAAVE